MKVFKLFASLVVLVAVRADNVKDFIEKTSSAARVINAIALTTNILENKLPIDKVIAELLKVDGNGIDELEKFDSDGMERFMNALATAEQQVTDEQPLENAALVMGGIAHYLSKNHDAANIPSTLTGLAALQNFPIRHLNIVDAKKIINGLRQVITTSEGDLAGFQGELVNLFVEVKAIEALPGVRDLIDQLDVFATRIELLDLLAEPDVYMLKQSPDPTALGANVHLIDALLKESADLNRIETFLASRLHYSFVEPIYTAGFVNGYEDIDKLEKDVKNEWLLETFGENINQKALSKLKKFTKHFRTLDESWKSSLTKDVLKSVRAAMELAVHQAQKPDVSIDVAQIVTGFAALPFPDPPLQKAQFGQELIDKKKILELKLKYEAILNITDIIRDADLNNFDGLDDKDNIPGLRKNLEVVRQIEPLLKLFQTPNTATLKELTTDIMASTVIAGFASNPIHAATDNFFIDVYNNMRNTSEALAQYTLALQGFRKIKATPMAANIRSVVQIVGAASSEFAQLRDVSKKLKKSKKTSSEMKQLLKFKAVRDDAKALGDGVTALVNMERVLAKKAQFEVYCHPDTGASVQTAIAAATTSSYPQKRRIIVGWGDHAGLSNNLNTLIGYLEARHKKIKPTTDFQSVWSNFKRLWGVPDLNAQLQLRLDAVTELHGLTQDAKLPPIIAALQEIAALDLNFARFDSALAKMNGTLKHVKKVLHDDEELRKAASQRLKKPKKPMSFYFVGGRKYEPFFTFLVIGLPSILAISFLLSWYCSNKMHKELMRSDREEDDDDEEEKPKPKAKKPKGKPKKNSKTQKSKNSKNSKNAKKSTTSAGKKGGKKKKKRSSEDGSRSKSRTSGGKDFDFMSFHLVSETSAADDNFLLQRRH